MTLGEKIKRFRKQAGLTQEQLAKKTNLSRSYIADVERNRYNPSFETLKSISKGLNIPLSKLSDEENNDNENLTPEFYAIQRNSKKLTQKEQQKLLKIMKATFEKLDKGEFEEDDSDDYL
jgi:DNA-binding XRE family transcriptional regulator